MVEHQVAGAIQCHQDTNVWLFWFSENHLQRQALLIITVVVYIDHVMFLCSTYFILSIQMNVVSTLFQLFYILLHLACANAHHLDPSCKHLSTHHRRQLQLGIVQLSGLHLLRQHSTEIQVVISSQHLVSLTSSVPHGLALSPQVFTPLPTNRTPLQWLIDIIWGMDVLGC